MCFLRIKGIWFVLAYALKNPKYGHLWRCQSRADKFPGDKDNGLALTLRGFDAFAEGVPMSHGDKHALHGCGAGGFVATLRVVTGRGSLFEVLQVSGFAVITAPPTKAVRYFLMT